MTTAELMARFALELNDVGIDDPQTIERFSEIALAEHCRFQGGPLVNADREWSELDS